MNVVISCDDNYMMPARIMLESLSRYNKEVALWFIYSDIKEQNLETLALDAKGYGWNIFW